MQFKSFALTTTIALSSVGMANIANAVTLDFTSDAFNINNGTTFDFGGLNVSISAVGARASYGRYEDPYSNDTGIRHATVTQRDGAGLGVNASNGSASSSNGSAMSNYYAPQTEALIFEFDQAVNLNSVGTWASDIPETVFNYSTGIIEWTYDTDISVMSFQGDQDNVITPVSGYDMYGIEYNPVWMSSYRAADWEDADVDAIDRFNNTINEGLGSRYWLVSTAFSSNDPYVPGHSSAENFYINNIDVSVVGVSEVPVPAAAYLFISGLISMVFLRKKKKNPSTRLAINLITLAALASPPERLM